MVIVYATLNTQVKIVPHMWERVIHFVRLGSVTGQHLRIVMFALIVRPGIYMVTVFVINIGLVISVIYIRDLVNNDV